MTDWKKLFTYDAWANHETLGSLRSAASPPAKARKVLAHIVGAERLWLWRIERRGSEAPAVWPELSPEECEAGFEDLAVRWRALLPGLSDGKLASPVAYVNSRGEKWSSALEDVLMHVVLHSVHHRGQIAAEMRDAGYEPAYTDFIHAVRQGLI